MAEVDNRVTTLGQLIEAERVSFAAAGERVRAGAAVQRVVPGAADEAVRARVAVAVEVRRARQRERLDVRAAFLAWAICARPAGGG